FFLSLSAVYLYLYSFPTRRSSDLRFGPGNMSVARMHVEEAGMFDEEVRDGAWAGLELLDRLQAMGLTVVKVSQAWGWLWLPPLRSEEHTSELQSREKLVCRLLFEQ